MLHCMQVLRSIIGQAALIWPMLRTPASRTFLPETAAGGEITASGEPEPEQEQEQEPAGEDCSEDGTTQGAGAGPSCAGVAKRCACCPFLVKLPDATPVLYIFTRAMHASFSSSTGLEPLPVSVDPPVGFFSNGQLSKILD